MLTPLVTLMPLLVLLVDPVVLDEKADHRPVPALMGAELEALKGSRDLEAIDRVVVVADEECRWCRRAAG